MEFNSFLIKEEFCAFTGNLHSVSELSPRRVFFVLDRTIINSEYIFAAWKKQVKYGWKTRLLLPPPTTCMFSAVQVCHIPPWVNYGNYHDLQGLISLNLQFSFNFSRSTLSTLLCSLCSSLPGSLLVSKLSYISQIRVFAASAVLFT